MCNENRRESRTSRENYGVQSKYFFFNAFFVSILLFSFSALKNNRKGESYYIILHYSCMLLVLSSSSPPSSHVQYYYCMYTYARVKCNEIFPHRQQTRQTHKKSKNEKRITRILSKGKLFGYVHAYKVFNFFKTYQKMKKKLSRHLFSAVFSFSGIYLFF